MSALPPTIPPYPYQPGVPQPTTSKLAIASLVLGLVFCLPGAAAVGLVLGIAGLVSIGRSEGRKVGGGYATAGIIISSLVLLGWAGFGYLFYMGMQYVDAPATIAAEYLGKVESGDFASARSRLTPEAATLADDARLKAIQARLQERFGRPTVGKFDWSFDAYEKLSPSTTTQQLTRQDMKEILEEIKSAEHDADHDDFPIAIRFTQGNARGLAVIRFPDDPDGTMEIQEMIDKALIEDVLLIDGTEMWWLLDRGAALIDLSDEDVENEEAEDTDE